jgi:hypothetical protein
MLKSFLGCCVISKMKINSTVKLKWMKKGVTHNKTNKNKAYATFFFFVRYLAILDRMQRFCYQNLK